MSPDQIPEKPKGGVPMEPPEETIKRLDELNKDADRLLKLTERWSDKKEDKKDAKKEPARIDPPTPIQPPKPEKISEDEAHAEKSALEQSFKAVSVAIGGLRSRMQKLDALDHNGLTQFQADIDAFPALAAEGRNALDAVNVRTDAGKKCRFGLKKDLLMFMNKEFAGMHDTVHDALRKISADELRIPEPPKLPKDSSQDRTPPPVPRMPKVDLPPLPPLPPSSKPPKVDPPPVPSAPKPTPAKPEAKGMPKATSEKRNSQAVREILWRWRTSAEHTDQAWCEMTGLNPADLYRNPLDRSRIILKNVSSESKLAYAKMLVDGDVKKGLRGFLQTEAGALQELVARHDEMSPATKQEIFGRIQNLRIRWGYAWQAAGRVAPPFMELPTVTPAGEIVSRGKPLAPLAPPSYDDLEQIDDSKTFHEEFMKRRGRTIAAEKALEKFPRNPDLRDGVLRKNIAGAVREFLATLKDERSATDIVLEQWENPVQRGKVSGCYQQIVRDTQRRLYHNDLEARSRWLLREIELVSNSSAPSKLEKNIDKTPDVLPPVPIGIPTTVAPKPRDPLPPLAEKKEPTVEELREQFLKIKEAAEAELSKYKDGEQRGTSVWDLQDQNPPQIRITLRGSKEMVIFRGKTGGRMYGVVEYYPDLNDRGKPSVVLAPRDPDRRLDAELIRTCMEMVFKEHGWEEKTALWKKTVEREWKLQKDILNNLHTLVLKDRRVQSTETRIGNAQIVCTLVNGTRMQLVAGEKTTLRIDVRDGKTPWKTFRSVELDEKSDAKKILDTVLSELVKEIREKPDEKTTKEPDYKKELEDFQERGTGTPRAFQASVEKIQWMDENLAKTVVDDAKLWPPASSTSIQVSVLSFFALRRLTSAAAKIIVEGTSRDVSLFFGNTEMDTEAAGIIAQSGRQLAVGTKMLAPDVAAELAKNSGELQVSPETLSPETAKGLATKKDLLKVHCSRTPDAKALAALAGHQGTLELHIPSLTDEEGAKALAKHPKLKMHLSNMKEEDVPEGVLRALAASETFEGLDLRIKKIRMESINTLSGSERTRACLKHAYVDEITDLTEDDAKEVKRLLKNDGSAGHYGYRMSTSYREAKLSWGGSGLRLLQLPKVRSLSVKTAEILQAEGDAYTPVLGITEINDPALARALAASQVLLPALAKATPEVIDIFAKAGAVFSKFGPLDAKIRERREELEKKP